MTQIELDNPSGVWETEAGGAFRGWFFLLATLKHDGKAQTARTTRGRSCQGPVFPEIRKKENRGAIPGQYWQGPYARADSGGCSGPCFGERARKLASAPVGTADGRWLYDSLVAKNRGDLKVQEYLMPHAKKRPVVAKRVKPTPQVWQQVLDRAGHRCEWLEEGQRCGLHEGEVDPIGGGRVKLTPDHKRPHSVESGADPRNPDQWRALCGRHQVIKKNYWDSMTGKLNTYAIVQAAPRAEKRRIFLFLLEYFGYRLLADGSATQREEG